MTTMPLRVVSRSFWKNSENERRDWVSMTFGNSSPPKRAFCAARWLDRSNSTGSSASRSTPSVSQQASKSPGSSFSGDEAAVQPNLSAAGLGEQFDCFCESVEQTSAAFGPSEPLDHLVPRRDVLTRWQQAAVWIERWKHTTTLSLWLLPTATHEFGAGSAPLSTEGTGDARQKVSEPSAAMSIRRAGYGRRCHSAAATTPTEQHLRSTSGGCG
jgi:hypothetical protein